MGEQLFELSQSEQNMIKYLLKDREDLIKGLKPRANTPFVYTDLSYRQYAHTEWLEQFKKLCVNSIASRTQINIATLNNEYQRIVLEYIKRISMTDLISTLDYGGHCHQHVLIQSKTSTVRNLYNLVILCASHSDNYTNIFKAIVKRAQVNIETSIEIMHGLDSSVTLQTYITPSR